MKSFAVVIVYGLSCFVASFLASNALADHDTPQVQIEAPLQATACPLIQVLGLTIDTTGAKFKEVANCAALVVGQFVEVKLVNDTPPLRATRVEQENEDEDDD